MPTYGDVSGSPEDVRANGVRSDLELPLDGTIRWDVTTLTFDDTKSQDSGTDYSLQDLVAGNAWRLRRIVGKLWASTYFQTENIGKRPPAIDYAAGFIVGKTDDEGTPTADFYEVNPLAQEGMDDPWIWRRRWLLSTLGERATAGIYAGAGSNTYYAADMYLAQQIPSSTANYHSVADGPHIDQKTARRIDRQERLLFVQAARIHSQAGFVNYSNSDVPWLGTFLDYRLLGSVVKTAAGNRRNASR